MNAIPKVIQIGEKQFYYIDQGKGAPLVYVHGTMLQMNKLGEDNLPELEKSKKTNFTKRISTPND